jgi:prepilin-type processing-associated H-X9-DG protein
MIHIMQQLIKTTSKSTFIILLIFSLAGATMAQAGRSPENLFKALAAQGITSTIQAGELTAKWRVVTLGKPDNEDATLYYTDDKVLSIGGQNYIIAYQLETPGNSHQGAIQKYLVDQSQQPYQHHRTPELLSSSELALTLLNKNQHLYEVKKFDPASDTITTLSKTLTDRIISQSNLKQIALATFFCAQDHHDTYPPMISAKSANEITEVPQGKFTATTTVQDLLMRYIPDKQLFLQPATHRPYLPNYTLSQISEEKIDDPAATILFFEDAPDTDGMRNVVYADGHVAAITEAEFQRERKAQGISESGYPPAVKTGQ